VNGLLPENVTVVDSYGNILSDYDRRRVPPVETPGTIAIIPGYPPLCDP